MRYRNPPQRFCSSACYLAQRWGGKQDVPKCGTCGIAIVSVARGRKYCSRQCYALSKIGKPAPHISNRILRPCSWCGEIVNRPASEFTGVKAFCNQACMAEWQSEFATGTAHPRWKGGDHRSLGIGWKAARKKAMAKANGVCEHCRKTAAKHIHHRLPIRYFARVSDAHFADNLAALCVRCHSTEHRRLTAALPLLDMLRSEST